MKELYMDDISEEMARELLEDEEFLPPDVVIKLKRMLERFDNPGDAPSLQIPPGFVEILRKNGLSDEDIVEEMIMLYGVDSGEAEKYL